MERIKLTNADNPLGVAALDAADGTVVIVVEHGLVEVGRYHAPALPERWHPAFERPLNGDALRQHAYRALMSHFPGTPLAGEARVFSCPSQLLEKACWSSSEAAESEAASSEAAAAHNERADEPGE